MNWFTFFIVSFASTYRLSSLTSFPRVPLPCSMSVETFFNEVTISFASL